MDFNNHVIHCPNSTFQITLQCAMLTSLQYDQDAAAWRCLYSDWSYGLFAICGMVMIFLPLLLIIFCCVKACNRKQKDGYEKFHGYCSTTRSNSVYPESGRDLPCLADERCEVYSQKHGYKDKLYYAYPAYGTHSNNSFTGGSLSQYPELTVAHRSDMPAQSTTQSIQINSTLSRVPRRIRTRRYLSSSDPVVTTMLRETKRQLHEKHRIDNNEKETSSSVPRKQSIQRLEENFEQFGTDLNGKVMRNVNNADYYYHRIDPSASLNTDYITDTSINQECLRNLGSLGRDNETLSVIVNRSLRGPEDNTTAGSSKNETLGKLIKKNNKNDNNYDDNIISNNSKDGNHDDSSHGDDTVSSIVKEDLLEEKSIKSSLSSSLIKISSSSSQRENKDIGNTGMYKDGTTRFENKNENIHTSAIATNEDIPHIVENEDIMVKNDSDFFTTPVSKNENFEVNNDIVKHEDNITGDENETISNIKLESDNNSASDVDVKSETVSTIEDQRTKNLNIEDQRTKNLNLEDQRTKNSNIEDQRTNNLNIGDNNIAKESVPEECRIFNKARDRISASTPTNDMVTRQDFDDYLSDSVLNIPEGERNGTFLIRHSVSRSNCKVLTMYCKSKETNTTLYYFTICYGDEGDVYVDNCKETFTSIDELITHYRSNRSILPCLLRECLGKHF